MDKKLVSDSELPQSSVSQPPPIDVAVTHALDIPTRATEGAAGYDVVASENAVVEPGSRKTVSTGMKLAMPKNVAACDPRVAMYATIKGRSGLAKKGIDVHSGTIDWDYRGEIKVVLINNSETQYEVHAGDRIAQLIFSLALLPNLVSSEQDVEHADPTERGSGGFGSTGVERMDEVRVAIPRAGDAEEAQEVDEAGAKVVQASIVVSEA